MRPKHALKIAVTLSILTLAAAFLTGNWVIALLSGPVLALVCCALSLPTPAVLAVTRTGLPRIAWTDDEFAVQLDIEVQGGVGIISIHESLPKDFELVSGNTYHVFWVWRHCVKTFRYTGVCRKRGVYQLQPTEWHSWHGMYLREELANKADDAQSMVVLPRPTGIPYLRLTRSKTQLPPVGTTLTKVGISSTDFRDIRQYSYGDPYKAINWKASARRLSGGTGSLVTNQFESEGRRAVWILIDASPYMLVGDSLHNPFELCLHLACQWSRKFPTVTMKMVS